MSDPCSKYAAAKEPNDDDAHLLHEGPLAKAVAAAVSVEKALGVGEAAEEAPKAAAKALRTRMQTTLMVPQSHQSMSGSTHPSTSSRRVWSSRASRCRSSRQSLTG